MNIFTAAYEGMAKAVRGINERSKRGVAECPLCGEEVAIDDPCYVETGWCFDCDDTMDGESW